MTEAAPAGDDRAPPCRATAARIRALRGCAMLPGCWDKRFIRGMAEILDAPEPRFTARQVAQVTRLAHKYRRQLPPALVPAPEDPGP